MKLLIPILACVCASEVIAGEMETLDLLNHRLTVSMPKGSRNETRGHNIMAASEASDSETRLVFEDGKKKLVVMAWELFRRAGANFKDEVPKALKQWSESESTPFKISNVGDHITVGIPEKPNEEDDAILYAAAFVRHKDGLIQRVGIYFNPEFQKTPDRCAELAKQIIESIKIDERSLDLRAGGRELSVLNDGFRMTVTVPEGWTFTTKHGADFLVHNLEQVSDFGITADSIGIYIGGHPGYNYLRIDKDALIKRTREAPLFGRPREWVEFTTGESDGWKDVEIITDMPGLDDYWKAHVFTGGPDDKRLDDLLKIMATAKIVKEAKHDGGGQPATPAGSK